MLSKEMESKIQTYNKLRSQVDAMQREIEKYLDKAYNISTSSPSDTYGMDGNCPMYEWGTACFDIQQIKDIIAFKDEYYKNAGEYPDNKEISKYFA